MTVRLFPCSECGGFLPRGARACPHCQRPVGEPIFARMPAPLRGALLLGGGGLLSVTLAACYGGGCYPGPECGYYYDAGHPWCTDATQDTDGDLRCLDQDCDEGDPAVYEGAPDPGGDGIDQNCDGADSWPGSDAGS